MSQFTGMDIDAVRQLAAQMNHSAAEIRTIMQQLTNQLTNTPWVGPDREQFVGEWQSQHVAQLTHVVQALESASTLATRNAQQQEQASTAM